MAQLEQPQDNPHLPIEQSEVSFDKLMKDSAALKLVVQDAERSESWLHTKQTVLRWSDCQRLYESPAKQNTWEGTNVPSASLNMFTVAQHTQAIIPMVMTGLFADNPPFILQPRPGTKQNTIRAIESLLTYQLEDCGFREQIRLGVLECLVFGTAIWKWGWDSYTEQRKVYRRKAEPIRINDPVVGSQQIDTEDSDALELVDDPIEIERPVFDFIPLKNIYVDPGLRSPDIRKAKFVIHRLKVSASVLEDLREVAGYSIPDKAKLKALLFPDKETSPTAAIENLQPNNAASFQGASRDTETTYDPMEADRFEILERWDSGKVVTVLNRKLVIRNADNPYGRIPFGSVNFWDVPNSFYGLGLGHLVGQEQMLQTGILNARLDETSLNLNLPFIRRKASNIPTQSIRMRPGAIFDVDELTSLKPMDRIQAVPEAFMEVQASQARAEALSGANELMVQGNIAQGGGKSSVTKTATGSNLLAAASSARIQDLVERICVQVFKPVLYAFHDMNRDLLPMRILRRILNDELEQAYEGDQVEIKNARVVFTVDAASNMSARQKMAASLPSLIQMVLTDPVHAMVTEQGMKVDVMELLSMYWDVTGYKNKSDVIVPLTDEDKQRQQQEFQQQLQLQQAKNDQALNSKLSVIDSENSARAYRELQREMIRNAAKDEPQGN